MKMELFQKEISDIEYEWEHLTKESEADLDNFLFISIKSAALKMSIHTLHVLLNEKIETDKNLKLIYQKLAVSLGRMEDALNLKIKSGSDLTTEHIKDILSQFRTIEPEMAVLKEYITK
jgi:hypothetical protein